MRKLQLLTNLVIVLFCSCRENGSFELSIFGDFSVVSNLVDKDTVTSELLYPTGIVLLDSMLFIKESKSDSMIFCYDMTTNFLQGFLKKGNGPGEAIVLFKIALCGDTAIQASVDPNSRLFIYSKNTISKEFMPMPSEVISLKQGYLAFTTIAKIDDETLIYSGKDPNDERTNHTRFCIYNLLSDSVYCFGKYPSEDKDLDRIPENDYNRLTAYQGEIIVKPDRSKAVMIYFYAVGFDIIDLKSKTVLMGKFYQYPKVDVILIPNTDIRAIKRIPDSYRGFIDFYCNNDYIYFLYSDKTFGAPEGYSTGRHILKYDWEGNPVCRYILSEEISSFTVDKYEKYLYATRSDEEFGYVIRYQMN